ncbi:MAG: deoxyribose-phosphate aldolase [Flaviaesturariibacter sp.]|nr:deoxyribose-phosphate aldolase [Flaviaesturariibacter sp.]
MNLAPLIDHTILKPTTTFADIQKVCKEAIQYRFAAVCVPPYFVSAAKMLLQNSEVKTATVIGFPFGYGHFSAKAKEVEQATGDGADEVDMVINLAALKAADLTYLKAEIAAIVKLTEKAVSLKLIIESGVLSSQEIITCCELYRQYPVDFLKTSTGYAEKSASVEAVQLIREHLPSSIRIKASGGIRNYAFAKSLVDAGAGRLGCSASVAIVNGEKDMAAEDY